MSRGSVINEAGNKINKIQITFNNFQKKNLV